jgi:hypothetical protein
VYAAGEAPHPRHLEEKGRVLEWAWKHSVYDTRVSFVGGDTGQFEVSWQPWPAALMEDGSGGCTAQ